MKLAKNSQKDGAEFTLGRHLLGAVVLGVALVAGVGGWATTARLGSAVIVAGTIKVDRELRTAQHADGGRHSAIMVKKGQAVRAGQVLMTLDASALEAEHSLRHQQYAELSLRAVRLEAERNATTEMVLPPHLSTDDADLATLFAAEQLLLQKTLLDREGRKALLALQIAQLASDADALASRQAALQEENAVVEKSAARVDELAKKGTVASATREEAESALARSKGELGEISARLVSNRVERQRLEFEITRIDEIAAFEAQRALLEITPRLSELKVQMAELDRQIGLTKVRAPEAGVIHELAVNTIGQVVSPGQVLASIVPAGADLVVEFQIQPKDIDQIVPGQPARLRFAAFNQAITPELAGRVSVVAPATSIDPTTGMTYYLAQAEVLAGERLPDGSNLIPGMPVEVYVPLRERTAFEYLTQPIRDSFRRGMNEE